MLAHVFDAIGSVLRKLKDNNMVYVSCIEKHQMQRDIYIINNMHKIRIIYVLCYIEKKC